jgi:outer membrane protein assembly factor BamB
MLRSILLPALLCIALAPANALADSPACFFAEDFEDASWADDWTVQGPVPPILPAAAHDGALGVANAAGWLTQAQVPLGGQRTQVGAWSKLLPAPGASVLLGVGLSDGSILLFRVANGVAALLRMAGGPPAQLAAQPFAQMPGAWYRTEIDFPAPGDVRARVFSEGAELLLELTASGLATPGSGVSFSAPGAMVDSLSACNGGAQPPWRFRPLWATISGDAQHTGQRGINVEVDPNVEPALWTFAVDQHEPTEPCPDPYGPEFDVEVIYSSPVVSGDGKVFFGSQIACLVADPGEGWFYGVDGCTGEFLWQQPMDGWVESSPSLSNDGRVVYVGSKSGKLTAMSAQTGAKLWEYTTGDSITSSPTVDRAGNVYIGSLDGKLYATDAQGNLRWSYAAPDTAAIHATPALSREQDVVYVGWTQVCGGPFGDPCDPIGFALAAVDAATGEELWTFPVGGQVWGSAMVSPYDGAVVFADFGLGSPSFVYSLAPDGSEQWRYPIDSYSNGIPSIGPDGSIYIGTYAATFGGSAKLHAIQPDGTPKWVWASGTQNANIQASPALINGGDTVIFGVYGSYSPFLPFPPSGGGIHALSTTDGSAEWFFDTEISVQTSPAVTPDGRIFFGDWNGLQHAIGPANSYLCE